jgi:hypothetical protein
MPTVANPERAINDSDTGRESFWGSDGVATQVQIELPLANISNSMNTSVKVKSENTDLLQVGSSKPNFLRHRRGTF